MCNFILMPGWAAFEYHSYCFFVTINTFMEWYGAKCTWKLRKISFNNVCYKIQIVIIFFIETVCIMYNGSWYLLLYNTYTSTLYWMKTGKFVSIIRPRDHCGCKHWQMFIVIHNKLISDSWPLRFVLMSQSSMNTI